MSLAVTGLWPLTIRIVKDKRLLRKSTPLELRSLWSDVDIGGNDYWLRLDSDRMTVRILFRTHEILFDHVQTVTLEDKPYTDRKSGQTVHRFFVQIKMKSGDSRNFSIIIFEAETELRDVLKRREIEFIDNAPGRVSTRVTASADLQTSQQSLWAAQQSLWAAQEEYRLSIINAAQPVLAGSVRIATSSHDGTLFTATVCPP